MKIIVVGCGKIGTSIISSLVSDGHDVIAVDDNPAAAAEIGNIYDVMSLCGNGVDCETLEEAGVGNADLFVAVTASDELNMLSCFLAGRMGAGHTIARIRNPEYNDRSLGFMKQQLGLSVALNPELFTAEEMFNILKLPAAGSIETFSGRNLEMVELRLREDSPIDGMSLTELRRRYRANYLVSAVQRGHNVYIPDGSFVLRAGDKMGLTAAPSEVQKLLKMLGLVQKQARSVMILGASTTAFYLAEQLLAAGNAVKIIDRDEHRCREFASRLPREAVIICGDGAEQELLIEEGIRQVDAFVALTGMDEENILISCFAASQKVPKVITKVNRPELAAMAERLGLDCIVSPQKITSDILARYARARQNTLGSNIETLYKMMEGNVEALEFNVGPDFKGQQTPLRELKLKLRPNLLIAGIIRGRRAMIPSGEDEILPGDRVIVITAEQGMFDLSDILR